MQDGTKESNQRAVFWSAYRLSAEGVREEGVRLAREAPLLVRVNGQRVAVMMRTPGMDAELVTGFLVSEGILVSAADIVVMALEPSLAEGLETATGAAAEDWLGDVADARLASDATISRSADAVRMVRAVAGDVGAQTGSSLPVIERDVRVSREALVSAAADLRMGQTLRKLAGGVHAFGLYRHTGERLAVCEDVGRHNAMDKAVGWCLRQGRGDTWAFGLCSGRLSYEMVAKAARVGLPMLVSFSAPSSLGVATAARCGITVLGYLDEQKVLAYTHSERVMV